MADLGVIPSVGQIINIAGNSGAIHAGWGELSGTVGIEVTPSQIDPVIKRVVVIDRVGGYIASTYSAADGTWSIQAIPFSVPLFVIAFDDSETYNAEVADFQTPTLMV